MTTCSDATWSMSERDEDLDSQSGSSRAPSPDALLSRAVAPWGLFSCPPAEACVSMEHTQERHSPKGLGAIAKGRDAMHTMRLDTSARPCVSCRYSKVLCDRGFPCSRCVRLGIECCRPKYVQRGRPSKQRLLERERARLAARAAEGSVP